MLNNINPVKTKAWQKLQTHFETVKSQHMRQMFESDPQRFSKFSILNDEILLDYSKNRINEQSVELLIEFAKECKLESAIEAMFKGEKINETEGRAVLHTALRNFTDKELIHEDVNILNLIRKEQDKMKSFTQKLHSGDWKGHSGKKITQIVNIGIGGSDLGPVMVTEALKPYWIKGIETYYVSNVDGAHIFETLKKLDHERCLFMIASKTFTTQETMTNADTAKKWLIEKYNGVDSVVKSHFVALSTNTEAVRSYGIDPKNMFEFWDWVGGRFSLWSSIGLSIACTIGYENYESLLRGAEKMDKHFRNSDFKNNMPVMLALLGIWYNNFFKCETHSILCYDQYLHRFAAYLQQGDMESNGKSVDRNGKSIDYQTGSIIWGEPGTNGQHAFYQLIHQGTKLIPSDFIAAAIPHHHLQDLHNKLLANFFAQTEALMKGKSESEVLEEIKDLAPEKRDKILPYKVFKGNIPSNSILINKLSPEVMGSLVALYEHKIFVQGILFNVYSFDQWGVQLGKQVAQGILPELENDLQIDSHLSSTNGLINTFKKFRNG
ncbi:MAG: glucose-6-phosphate isomerase [Cytophagales bacterium]